MAFFDACCCGFFYLAMAMDDVSDLKAPQSKLYSGRPGTLSLDGAADIKEADDWRAKLKEPKGELDRADLSSQLPRHLEHEALEVCRENCEEF